MTSKLSNRPKIKYAPITCTPCRRAGAKCGRQLPVCGMCSQHRNGGIELCKYPVVIRDQNTRHVFGVYMDDFDVTRNIHSPTPAPDIVLSDISIDQFQYALMQLPSRAVCGALWNAFRDSVYPIYPLIDLDAFQTWETEFWEWYDRSSDFDAVRSFISMDPSIICLFLAVLCSGAMAARQDVWAHPPLGSENRNSVILSLKTGARMALNARSFEDCPRLYTIMSSVLLDLVLGSQVESSDHKSYVKSMTVAAQRIGLNDPNIVLGPDQATQQLCRRVWDHIRWLDAQCCIAIGTASEDPFREELIADNHRKPPDTWDQHGDIPVLLAYARTEVAGFEHRVIGHVRGTILDDPRTGTRAYDGSQFERIKTVLEDTKARLDLLPDWEHLDPVKVDAKWAEDVVDMLLLEAAAVDHVPKAHKSLNIKSQHDWTIFSIAANKYLQAYLELAKDTRFEQYSWFLSHYRAAFLQCLYLLLIGMSMWPADYNTETTVEDAMQYMEKCQTDEEGRTFRKVKTMFQRVLRVN